MLDAAPPDFLSIAVEEGHREVLLLQPVVRGLLKRRDRKEESDEAAGDAKGQRLTGQFDEDPAPAGDVKSVHEGGESGVAVPGPFAACVQRRIDESVEREKSSRCLPPKPRLQQTIEHGFDAQEKDPALEIGFGHSLASGLTIVIRKRKPAAQLREIADLHAA